MKQIYKHPLGHGGFGIPLVLLLAALVFSITACTDEREAPTAPEEDSYTETLTLFDEVPAEGQAMSRAFTLRDQIVDGMIYLTCCLKADSDLVEFDNYGLRADTLSGLNDNLEVLIVNYQLQDVLLPEDSLALDSLIGLKQANLDSIAVLEVLQDSLDTFLDDRFKVSIWLDGDTVEYYPGAIFLDSTAIGYIGGDDIVWGQGFYLMPPVPADSTVIQVDTVTVIDTTVVPADTTVRIDSTVVEIIRDGWHARTMRLKLDEFWVADGGWDIGQPYYHPAKPSRGSSLTDQYPIRDWLDRLTEGSHTLHVRFAASGVTARVTASLYIIYNREG